MTIRELYRAENLPVFQNKMFDSETAARSCPTGDLVLAQNMETGTVSNVAFDPDLLDYDSQYQNEQAGSSVFRRHIEAVTNIIDRSLGGKTILEVGCGKGFFLNHLRNLGYEAIGIDPAYEGDGPEIVKARFEPGLGLRGDVVVLRHVLEHIPNPLTFLEDIARANGGTGLVYIEVPCLDWILLNRAWFDLFYEHVNYFRLDDLIGFFGTVHESGHLFGEQYIYVMADLDAVKTPRFSSAVEFPTDFFSGLDELVRSANVGKRRSVWGAAAKGMMFSLYMKRAGVDIDFAIDINPAKQGKYLAGSGLCVVSPSDALELLDEGDDIFVMNSNYIDEIIALSHGRFRYLKVDQHEF